MDYNKLAIVTGIIKIFLKVLVNFLNFFLQLMITFLCSFARLSWSVSDLEHLGSLVYSRCKLMPITCRFTCGDLSQMSSELYVVFTEECDAYKPKIIMVNSYATEWLFEWHAQIVSFNGIFKFVNNIHC